MNKSVTYLCEAVARLDVFLSEKFGQSRSQIAQLIESGAVKIDEKIVVRSGVKLKLNSSVFVEFPQPKESVPMEVDFSVEVLYEDDELMVINKPSGLTVHPAPSVKEATLVDWLKKRGMRLSTLSGEERHGIVHRLDKGTSGVMVIAKTNQAHEFLSLQLQDKSMGRYYTAVVTPPLKDDMTIVECPIARSAQNRLKMSCSSDGKDAKTAFKVVGYSEKNQLKDQLVVCKLFTGRTHQIRVHLEKLNRHILGDHLYVAGAKDDKTERILLHAYKIYFVHPTTGEKLSFVADFDDYMKQQLDEKFTKDLIYDFFKDDNAERSFSTNI